MTSTCWWREGLEGILPCLLELLESPSADFSCINDNEPDYFYGQR
jgi:hypothetical protein